MTKHNGALLLVTCMVCGFVSSSHAQVFNPDNGHYYQFVAAGTNWDGARQAAASMTYKGGQGYLATITSAAEENFILTNFSSDLPVTFATTPVWFGGFQPPNSPEPAGNYQWITGEPFVYTHWASGEPNNNGNESVIEVRRDGFWNDLNASIYRGNYIVEFSPSSVPEPSAMVLLGSGIVAFGASVLARKRRQA